MIVTHVNNVSVMNDTPDGNNGIFDNVKWAGGQGNAT